MKIVKVLTNFINKPIKLDLRPIDKLPDNFATVTNKLSEDIFETGRVISAKKVGIYENLRNIQ